MLKRLILIDLAVIVVAFPIAVISSEAAAVIFVVAGIVLIVLAIVAGVRWLSSRSGALPFAGRDLALVVGGIVLLAIAIPMTFDDLWLGVGSIVFGLALLTMPLAGRIGGGGGRTAARVDGRAVVIDGLRGKVWGGRIVLTIAGVGGAMWFAIGTTADRWIGLLMAVCFAIGIGSHLRQGPGPFRIVIDPDGLRWQTGRKRHPIAWDDLIGVDVYDIEHSWFLSLPGTDLSLESFPVHPKTFAAALRAWAANPRLRSELGTEAAIQRLRSPREARQPVKLQPHDVREHS